MVKLKGYLSLPGSWRDSYYLLQDVEPLIWDKTEQGEEDIVQSLWTQLSSRMTTMNQWGSVRHFVSVLQLDPIGIN